MYGAEEDVNENGEVILAKQDSVHASWDGYDYESGIVAYLVGIGISVGDTSVTNGFINYGRETQGYITNIWLNVTDETGDLYYVTVIAQNGAGVYSNQISSKPIHVYGENSPGIIYDGRSIYEDTDFQRDFISIGASFSDFKSPACGILRYEWALGTKPSFSDVIPFSSFGIVMINDTYGLAQADVPLTLGQTYYVTVVAYTGINCYEDIITSTSDGILVDYGKPDISIMQQGLFDESIVSLPSNQLANVLYQTQYDRVQFKWNASDAQSEVNYTENSIGSLPYLNDFSYYVEKQDTLICASTTMSPGQTSYMTALAADEAKNIQIVVSQPITIDDSPPLLENFSCTKYLSFVAPVIKCEWDSVMDNESPITNLIIGLGLKQNSDNIHKFEKISLMDRTWLWNSQNHENLFLNKTIFVTLQAINSVNLSSSAYVVVIYDFTPPAQGIVAILDQTTESSDTSCQLVTSSLVISWSRFDDQESGIQR